MLSAEVLTPCSPAKRLRTSISIERSPERFEQLKFLQVAVTKLEKQQYDVEKKETKEEEQDFEEDKTDPDASQEFEQDECIENRKVNMPCDETSLKCDQSSRKLAIKMVVSKLKTVLNENGEFDLEGSNTAELSEILDVLVMSGAFEKKGMRYVLKKQVVPAAAASIPSMQSLAPLQPAGHKPYFAHPHGIIDNCDQATLIAMSLSTKAAMGTLGASIHQQFLPPCPEDMLYYQTKCLEGFMHRYSEFYQTVTRLANKM